MILSFILAGFNILLHFYMKHRKNNSPKLEEIKKRCSEIKRQSVKFNMTEGQRYGTILGKQRTFCDNISLVNSILPMIEKLIKRVTTTTQISMVAYSTFGILALLRYLEVEAAILEGKESSPLAFEIYGTISAISILVFVVFLGTVGLTYIVLKQITDEKLK